MQYITLKKSLLVICFAHKSNPDDKRLRLPSWVTDWTDVGSDCAQLVDVASKFDAAGGRVCDVYNSVERPNHHGLVSVKGICLDTIVGSQGGKDFRQQVYQASDDGSDDGSDATNDGLDDELDVKSIVLSIVRTLIFFNKHDEHQCLGERNPCACEEYQSRDLITLAETARQLNGPLRNWYLQNLLCEVRGKDIESRFTNIFGNQDETLLEPGNPESPCPDRYRLYEEQGFQLDVGMNNSICLVPKTAKTDDQICILFGCPVPVLLHPLDSGGFRFTGMCYVDGFMHGEAMEMMDQGFYQQQSFDIY